MKELIVILLILLPSTFFAAAGDLDPTFGGGGIVTTPITGSMDQANAALLQPDGKIIAAGYANFDVFAVARYNADGTLDSTFGSGGIVTTDIIPGKADEARAAILQPDGKIVGVGFADSTRMVALIRYNTNGMPDSTFGNGGIVTTTVSSGFDQARAAVLQPDGKIVAAGSSNNEFAVFRYTVGGVLDPDFGGGSGFVTTPIPGGFDQIRAVALQPDGKIVAAGGANGFNAFGLVRYLEDGTLDPAFGIGGITITDVSPASGEGPNAILIQPDGKIVVAGNANGGDYFALLRYNADGNLDDTFGSGGIVTTDIVPGVIDHDSGLALQTDGKIIAAGIGNFSDFAVIRYHTDGTLDSTFGSGGIVVTDITAGQVDEIRSVVIQPDSKIMTVGFASNGNEFALARYLASGISTLCDGSESFCDDFSDGVPDANWSYIKPSWSENGGSLVGIPAGGKAFTIATPAFAGCGACTIRTSMQSGGGAFNKLFFYGWFVDKKNTLVVLMKQQNNKFVMKQVVAGVTVRKAKGIVNSINPGQFYEVEVAHAPASNSFHLTVDGNLLTIMPSAITPAGAVGFAVKNTTGRFDFIVIH